MTYYATRLRSGRWAVRPSGCLGTCGWLDGQFWTVRYVNANSADEALRRAHAARA